MRIREENMNFWFIQAIGAVALIFVFFSWNAKTRKSILVLQSINIVFFIAHYLLLSAFIGAVMCLIVLGRNIVLYLKDKGKKWASHPAWFYALTLVAVGVLAVAWTGWISALPVIGVSIGMYGMWHDRPADIRFYMLISAIIWIPYTIAVQSYSGLLNQAVATIAILIVMYRHDRREIPLP